MGDRVCQLCEKNTVEKVNFYVGGFVTYAHESCLNIVKKGFDLREKYNQLVKKTKNKRKDGR